MRAALSKALIQRRLVMNFSQPNSTVEAAPSMIPNFDPYDMVAHYRNLGGTRIATVRAGTIKVDVPSEETPEAAQFWRRSIEALSPGLREAIALCLLYRGRF